MANLTLKQNIEQRIKAVNNRIQLLTDSKEDKAKREVLLFSLRDLQREIQIYLWGVLCLLLLKFIFCSSFGAFVFLKALTIN